MADKDRMREAFIRQGMRSKAQKAKLARLRTPQGHSDPMQGGRGTTDNRDNRDTRRK